MGYACAVAGADTTPDSASASNNSRRFVGRKWKILKNDTYKMPNYVDEYATIRLN